MFLTTGRLSNWPREMHWTHPCCCDCKSNMTTSSYVLQGKNSFFVYFKTPCLPFRCIFSSQKLGTWQYLADIPFATISPRMLWRIFYTLHLDYHEESCGDFGGQVHKYKVVVSSKVSMPFVIFIRIQTTAIKK